MHLHATCAIWSDDGGEAREWANSLPPEVRLEILQLQAEERHDDETPSA